jgi:hypothetical protein
MLLQWGRRSGWQTVQADSDGAIQEGHSPGLRIGGRTSRNAARAPSRDAATAHPGMWRGRCPRTRTTVLSCAVQEGDGPGRRWARRTGRWRSRPMAKASSRDASRASSRDAARARQRDRCSGWGESVGTISFQGSWGKINSWDCGGNNKFPLMRLLSSALGCGRGRFFLCGMSTSPLM